MAVRKCLARSQCKQNVENPASSTFAIHTWIARFINTVTSTTPQRLKAVGTSCTSSLVFSLHHNVTSCDIYYTLQKHRSFHYTSQVHYSFKNSLLLRCTVSNDDIFVCILRCFGQNVDQIPNCNKLYQSRRHVNIYIHTHTYIILKYIYRSFSTRVSQLKIWYFWVIGIERNVCRCTFNSVITQFVTLAAGEQLCRRCTHRKV
jgi:hypothetical protein